jgi:hypothetical protein
MILTNPGGPGTAGVTFLLENPELEVLHPNFDLVSWNPRGVGLALPGGSCVLPDNSLTSTIGATSNLQRRSSDKLYGPEIIETDFLDVYQLFYEIGQSCQAVIGGPDDIGPHANTASVAQDMISILDAFTKTEDRQ